MFKTCRTGYHFLRLHPLACLQKLNGTQSSVQGVPVKVHLLLSLQPRLSGMFLPPCLPMFTQHTAATSDTAGPPVGGLLPCPVRTARLPAAPKTCSRRAAWPQASRLCSTAASAASLTLQARAFIPSVPGFSTGSTVCKQDYKQLPCSHRDVIILIKLKPSLLQHPLHTGSFTKHILPLLYSKRTSWCTSSNPSYHPSS